MGGDISSQVLVPSLCPLLPVADTQQVPSTVTVNTDPPKTKASVCKVMEDTEEQIALPGSPRVQG